MAASTWAPFTRLGLGLGLGLRLRLGAPFRRHMLSHTAYRYPVDLRSASRADCLRDRDMYCDTTQRLLSTFPSFPSLPKTLELDRQQETKRGQIQLILGPMFSGKTSELLRRVKRYAVAKRRCLVVKYMEDTRYGDGKSASTHDKEEFPAFPCRFLSESRARILGEGGKEEVDVIAVDEGQFFADLPAFVEEMAERGKLVIVAALSGTYRRETFSVIGEVMAKAEKLDMLSAVCMVCYRPASFSWRMSGEDEVHVIGGSDKYKAVCRTCYMNLSQGLAPTSID